MNFIVRIALYIASATEVLMKDARCLALMDLSFMAK